MKLKCFLVGILTFALPFCLFSQFLKPKLDHPTLDKPVYPRPGPNKPSPAFINPPSLNLNIRPSLNHIYQEIEHEYPEPEKIEQIKEQKTYLKEQLRRQPDKSVKEPANTLNSILPEVGTSFDANGFTGTAPADNNVAISNTGYLVSVSNSSIVYARNGVISYYQEIKTFINKPNWSPCDPVVYFDTDTKKFMMYVQQCGGLDANNSFVLLFSKSNNPADGWWIYTITGDPTGNSYFFDYPKLGISSHDLFITGNLYGNNKFVNSVVFQIDKSTGFAAQTLDYVYFYDIQGINFTLLPLSYGLPGTYGPGIYLVATHSGGGNQISFYEITDDIDQNPVLTHSYFSVPDYAVAGDALQGGSNCKLNTGDCRALSGFYLNNVIHFVFNSDYDMGYSGLNYCRLDVKNNSIKCDPFGLSGYDYAYPSIACFAANTTDKSAMIGFGRTSSSSDPEIRVVHVDDAFNWSSSVYVSSRWSVNCFSGKTVQRGGDYSGACRNYSTSTRSIYMSGAYGNFNGDWESHVAEVHGINVVATKDIPTQNLSLAPNPSSLNFNLHFTIEEDLDLQFQITDLQGQTISVIHAGKALKGENAFSFNTQWLPSGSYFLNIIHQNKIIRNENFLVQH